MIERSKSGNLLLVASGVVELVALGGFFLGVYSSTIESIVMTAVLLTAPSFLVGFLTGEYGFLYGLLLGVFPAIFALAVFPTVFLGLSIVGGALVLFVACVLLSGLSGAGGQTLAQWRVGIREDK